MSTIRVAKNDNESNESLIRRFTRKVQSSRKLIEVKQKQHRQPHLSQMLMRRNARTRAKLREQHELMRKLGVKVDDGKKVKLKH